MTYKNYSVGRKTTEGPAAFSSACPSDCSENCALHALVHIGSCDLFGCKPRVERFVGPRVSLKPLCCCPSMQVYNIVFDDGSKYLIQAMWSHVQKACVMYPGGPPQGWPYDRPPPPLPRPPLSRPPKKTRPPPPGRSAMSRRTPATKSVKKAHKSTKAAPQKSTRGVPKKKSTKAVPKKSAANVPRPHKKGGKAGKTTRRKLPS
jgi:hypothetical protein